MQATASERRVLIGSVAFMAVVTLAGALYWLRPVMIPLVLAMLLTHALLPVVDLLQSRARIPRWVAISGAVALCMALGVLLVLLVTDSVDQLKGRSATYERQINLLWESGIATLAGWGVDVGQQSLDEVLPRAQLQKLLGTAAKNLLSLLSNTFLVLIFAIYLMGGRRLPPEGGIRARIEAKVRRYLVVKLSLSVLTGAVSGIILLVLGVDFALLFGVLAVVLNFVPNVGSIIATLLPLPVILVDPNLGPVAVTLALLLPGAVQMTVGNVLEPKMLGESLALHPITVLCALVFWGMLWGIPGMLLAIPLTSVVEILAGELEMTRPFARLLAGQPLREEETAA
jgi:AI-2 transport protein TqsA